MVSYSASKRNGSQASFLPRRMLAFAMQGEVAQAGAHGGDSEQQCDPEAVHGVDPLEVGINFRADAVEPSREKPAQPESMQTDAGHPPITSTPLAGT